MNSPSSTQPTTPRHSSRKIRFVRSRLCRGIMRGIGEHPIQLLSHEDRRRLKVEEIWQHERTAVMLAIQRLTGIHGEEVETFETPPPSSEHWRSLKADRIPTPSGTMECWLWRGDSGSTVTTTINGSIYVKRLVELDMKYRSGSAAFYAGEGASIPYLILIYGGDCVTEYTLDSFAMGVGCPEEVFLSLSHGLKNAHDRDIVLGPSLNINNLRWSSTAGGAGGQHVIFEHLPPSRTPDGPPSPPPKFAVPELVEGSTKETDIYCSPLVLFETVSKILDPRLTREVAAHSDPQLENDVEEPKVIDRLKEIPSEPLSFDAAGKPEVPPVIQENKRLHCIVKQCLAEDPSHRPTATKLNQMLLKLCRSTMLGTALRDIGKSMKTGMKRLTIHQ